MPITGVAQSVVPTVFPDVIGGYSEGESRRESFRMQCIADALATLAGQTGNKKLKFGSTAVTGSELSIDTGLTLITGVVAILKQATAGVGNLLVTVDHGADGLLDLYVWKPTSADDNTMIAGSAAATVYWVAWGDA